MLSSATASTSADPVDAFYNDKSYVPMEGSTKTAFFKRELDLSDRDILFRQVVQRGPSSSNLETYNHWITNLIEKQSATKISTTTDGLIYLDNVRIVRPKLPNGDPLFPSRARKSGLSYNGVLYGDVVFISSKTGIMEITKSNVYLGIIPVMLGSIACHLHGYTPEMRNAVFEDTDDPLGYIIIKGTERLILSQENLALSQQLSMETSTLETRLTTQSYVGSTVLQLTNGKSWPTLKLAILQSGLKGTTVRSYPVFCLFDILLRSFGKDIKKYRYLVPNVTDFESEKVRRAKKKHADLPNLDEFPEDIDAEMTQTRGHLIDEVMRLVKIFVPRKFVSMVESFMTASMVKYNTIRDVRKYIIEKRVHGSENDMFLISKNSQTSNFRRTATAYVLRMKALQKRGEVGIPTETETVTLPEKPAHFEQFESCSGMSGGKPARGASAAGKKEPSKTNCENQVILELTNELFVGVAPEDKVVHLARMVAQHALVTTGARSKDDRDAWENNRVKFPSDNIATIFNCAFKVSSEGKGGKTLNVTRRQASDDRSLWVGREDNLGMLKRDTPIALVAQLGRLTSNAVRQSKQMGLRYVQPSQVGICCPAETPTSDACGLTKNLACSTRISLKRDSIEYKRSVLSKFVIDGDSDDDLPPPPTSSKQATRKSRSTPQFGTSDTIETVGVDSTIPGSSVEVIPMDSRGDLDLAKTLRGTAGPQGSLVPATSAAASSPRRGISIKFDGSRFPNPIMVDNIIYGWCNAETIVSEVRSATKRHPDFFDATVIFNVNDQTLEIYLTGTRPTRPLYVVDEEYGDLAVNNPARFDSRAQKDMTLEQLIVEGAVEYVSAAEQRFYRVSEYPSEVPMLVRERNAIRKESRDAGNSAPSLMPLYSEIDPLSLLGIAASLMPRPETCQGPRVTYQSNMVSQSLGLYHDTFHERWDTTFKRAEAERPTFETRTAGAVGLNRAPTGRMLIVAYHSLANNGEDGIVFQRESLERLRTVLYSSHKVTASPATEFFGFPEGDNPNTISISDASPASVLRKKHYHAIGVDGLPKLGSVIEKGDCIVARTRFRLDVTNTPTFVDTSIFAGIGDEGVIERVDVTKDIKGNLVARVKLRQNRAVNDGDKLASRYSQKGTVAARRSNVVSMPNVAGIGIDIENGGFDVNDLSEEQYNILLDRSRFARSLPSVASGPNKGLTPDIWINPLGMPSRMTVGKLYEMYFSKVALITGKRYDGSAFTRTTASQIEEGRDALVSVGLAGDGTEEMIHPNGTKLGMRIFVAPCFYQLLRHTVSDKIQYRAEGNVTQRTQQPVHGRSNGGGLRIGEMERAAMCAWGASDLVRERLMLASDAYKYDFCVNCGNQAVVQYDRRGNVVRQECRICPKDKAKFGVVETPFIHLLITRMLTGLGINATLSEVRKTIRAPDV